MIIIRRITRSGSSDVVVIPRPFAKALGLHRGDLMAIAVEGSRLVLKRIDQADLLRDTAASAPGGGAGGEGR